MSGQAVHVIVVVLPLPVTVKRPPGGGPNRRSQYVEPQGRIAGPPCSNPIINRSDPSGRARSSTGKINSRNSANAVCGEDLHFGAFESGLITSILAPFFRSSAEGTLMISLVTGWAPGRGVGGLIVNNSTSQMRTALGPMSRPPARSP